MRNLITKPKIEELRTSGVTVQMIDIRSNEEYLRQHIPDAVNIPAEKLDGETNQLSKEEPIVCVCNHGKERSQKAAETLYNLGFTRTFYLEGGTSGWFQ